MNLSALNKKELVDKCKELGIKKYSGKNKDQLIELITSHGGEPLIPSDTDNGVTGENVVISKISPVTHLKPLIKWSGGKGDEIKEFEKYFPSEFNTYIEPFVGGGAVFFYLAPQKAVINDVHKELVDFYKSIAENGYEVRAYTASKQANWGFMPLYPITVGFFLKLIPLSFFNLASILSNIFSFAGVYILFKTLKERLGENKSQFLVAYLFSAGSFYLSIPYNESLYILLLALVFYFTKKE